MTTKEKNLKEKLSENIDIAKKKLNEIKINANSSEEHHTKSLEELKSNVSEKAKEIKGDFSKALKSIKKKKSDFKNSLGEFKKEASLDVATKKAKRAEKYALSAINMVNVAIDKAEIAINHSVITAIEAEELRNK